MDSKLSKPFTAGFTLIAFVVVFCIVVVCAGCSGGNKTKTQKNVIVVLVDALRQDRLGVYGYNRNVSPNIDTFANESLVMENAISQSGWTAPSIMALFSSDYPKANLTDSRTYAQWLAKNNYQTAAYATNPILIPSMGYDKGFQTYTKKDWDGARSIVNWTLNWVERRDTSKPFYLYLHFMDVHDPYKPPKRFAQKFCSPYEGPVDGDVVGYKKTMKNKEPLKLSKRDIRQLKDLYDGDIAYLDHQFGRMLAGLKKLGVYDQTIIVFLSDHGDEFMEHNGIGHGHTVYDELIRVPLIIHGIDNLQGKRYSGLFELIDLAPTLNDILGIPFDYKVPGRSFAGYFKKNRPLKHLAFSEVYRTVGLRAGNWCISARTTSKKVIFYPHTKKYEFFDLKIDSSETNPLSQLQGEISDTLKKSLQQWRKVFGATGKRENYDPEAMRALRSLGYL